MVNGELRFKPLPPGVCTVEELKRAIKICWNLSVEEAYKAEPDWVSVGELSNAACALIQYLPEEERDEDIDPR